MNYLKEYNRKNLLLILLLTFISVFLVELYIIFVEQSSLFYGLSYFDVLLALPSFFSIKHFLLCGVVFLIIYLILFNEPLRNKILDFIYKYRYPLALMVLIVTVILKLHGSSISLLCLDGSHQSIYGVSRWIKTDEYTITTLMSFSQYYNDFGYFSSIVRAVPTDVFLLFGQPVMDIAVLLRPFHWIYLIAPRDIALSFYWMSGLIVLFVVSFEFGMLITNKNKKLSLAYTFLLVFSPFVQWWFAVNELVEMLVFGQLFILLVNYYFNTDDYIKRFICILISIICAGGFILALYPAWEVCLAYLVLVFFIWVIYKNWDKIKLSKKDYAFFAFFIVALGLLLGYIFMKSYDTIVIMSQTIIPGTRFYAGGQDMYWKSGDILLLFDYMRNVFVPFTPSQLIVSVSLANIISFFPLGIVLLCVVQFIQKKKDVLLYLLLVLNIIFFAYYAITWPHIIGQITFLGKTQSSRLLNMIQLVNLLMLIRAMALLDVINYKKIFKWDSNIFKKEWNFSKVSLVLSFLLVAIILVLGYISLGNSFYSMISLLLLFIIFGFGFFFILNSGNNSKAQTMFLIFAIVISLSAGALVNPVESGVDYFMDQPFMNEAESIVQQDPNAIWLVEGNLICCSQLLPVGAHTVNSIHVYPDLSTWSKIIPDNLSETDYNYTLGMFNRFSKINVQLVDENTSVVSLQSSYEKSYDVFVNLSVNDLEKLNVSYILTTNDLSSLSNDKISFDLIFADNNVKIFKVNYQ